MILIKDIFNHCRLRHFKEIKYFSRDGLTMPNGIGFQRGNFIKECADNANSFVLSEAVFCGQKLQNGERGGVIVFPACADIRLDRDKISLWLATLSQGVGAYAFGNAFGGEYIDGNNELYDERSTTIELGGLASKDLLHFAKRLAKEIHQNSILVKDLNDNKIYIKI